MFFGYISDFLSNPRSALILLLLALPPRLFAISAHEAAHAYVADRCGDHTARFLGRLTLNPFKHLDLVGVIMMLVLGIGWAKPVPVNPRNFRNGRKDDLKVSMAGIAMNLLLFLASFVVMTILIVIAFKRLGAYGAGDVEYVFQGFPYVLASTRMPVISEVLITPALGKIPGYLFDMLQFFAQVNIALAIFNILPVPPLDGYHLFSDLITRRNPFATQKVARICYGGLLVLCFTGLLGRGISFVSTAAFNGLGHAMSALLQALRIL